MRRLKNMAYSEQTDKITQRELNSALNDKINTARTHVDDPRPHVSDEDRKLWNAGGNMKPATPSQDGLMSAEDKEKLDGIDPNANNYVHPKSGVTPGTYIRTKVNDTGHVISADNPTTLDITVTNTTHFDGLTSDQYMKKGDTIMQGDPQCPTPDGSNPMSVVNVNYLKLYYFPLAGNCTITGPVTFNELVTFKKGISVTGNVTASGNVQGNRVLAGQGTDGGFSFIGESGYDTGMFSNSEGNLYFMQNGKKTDLNDLARLNSPALTGTPTAPTPSESSNSTQIATTAFTQTVVNNAKTSLTNTINSSVNDLRTELKNEMSGNYVLKSDVSNTANHIPRYNSAGHLVLPSGIEIW